MSSGTNETKKSEVSGTVCFGINALLSIKQRQQVDFFGLN